MDNQQLTRSSLTQIPGLAIPLTVWWSGFDYAFGYQIKMLQEFWGIPGER
ncbi:MAG: hypothetical protein U1E85_10845 [Rhodocyclaceae bacterium]